MSKTHEGIVAVEASQAAGLITWWTLGGTLALEALGQAWEGAGLNRDELPDEPSDKAALKRALGAVWPPCSVSPLKGGGYAVVQLEKGEHAEGRDPKMHTVAKSWIDEENFVQLRIGGKSDSAKLKEVWRALQQARGELDPVDVSQWLIKYAYSFNAVALRHTGGIYFIPSHYVDEWRKMTSILEEVNKGIVIYEIPAMRTEKAVSAILSALQQDVESELQKMQEVLDAGEVGVRALRARRADVEEMRKKVMQYEQLLGTNLRAIYQHADEIDHKLTRAILSEQE